jgi:hypothetical protein
MTFPSTLSIYGKLSSSLKNGHVSNIKNKKIKKSFPATESHDFSFHPFNLWQTQFLTEENQST